MKAARFEAVHELKDRYPITWLVCIAKVSRSGYYKWRKAQRFRMARQQRDQIIKEHIMAIHHSRPFYGYPRITVALKKEGNRYYLYCLRTTILLSFCSTRSLQQ
ncbi:hypothetical protein [Bacillus subtilis]|uniref:hypothetical protein n=1 Tax=Bacillus subtilis TaxID=1423 RepID=UPI0037428F08